MNTPNEAEMKLMNDHIHEFNYRTDAADYIATEEALEYIYDELGYDIPETLWVKSPAAAEYLYGIASGHIPSWFYGKRYYPELHAFDTYIPQAFWECISQHLDFPFARALLSREVAGYGIIRELQSKIEEIMPQIRFGRLYEFSQSWQQRDNAAELIEVLGAWTQGSILEMLNFLMPWSSLLRLSADHAISISSLLDIKTISESLDIKLPKKIFMNNPFFTAIKCISENSSVWYPWGSVVLIIENPESVFRQLGVLHAEDRPAVVWRDGVRSWYLNGVHVPKWLVETPAEEISPRSILKEQNAEIRREIIRKAGIEAILKGLNAKCIDEEGGYELLLLDMETPDPIISEEDEAYGLQYEDWYIRYPRYERGDEEPVQSATEIRYRPYLKMINPSTGDTHIEGVHPACRTVSAALAWRNGTGEVPVYLT